MAPERTMATIGAVDPAFPGAAPAGDPPYARVPDPGSLFGKRARRFATVAVGSEIAGYLGFMSALSAAQQRVALASPRPALPDTVDTSLANRMPPLHRELATAAGAQAIFDALLADLGGAGLDDGPAGVVDGLARMNADDRRGLLGSIGDGLFEVERLAEGAIAAAALQIWFALHACQVEATRLRNIGETICPCCGGAPVSSTVVDWPDATGNRYLTCSLCCTMWNMVRVKCTACGSEKGISYRSVEGSTGDIAAEVCDACQAYAKHLVMPKNGSLDPVADDVASYGLDMMLSDDGWHRSGLNPFLILP